MLLVTGSSTSWNFLWNAMLSFSPSQHRTFTCGVVGRTHPAHLVGQRLRRGRRHGLVAEGVALPRPERLEARGEGVVAEQMVEVGAVPAAQRVSERNIPWNRNVVFGSSMTSLPNLQPIHPAHRVASPACRRKPSSCPARGAPAPLHSSWRM